MPGTPDIVLGRYKTMIFIHGCFWHRHEGCKEATVPKTRTEFWETKFNRNVQKDNESRQALINDGWTVLTIWECEIEKHFDETMKKLTDQLKSGK